MLSTRRSNRHYCRSICVEVNIVYHRQTGSSVGWRKEGAWKGHLVIACSVSSFRLVERTRRPTWLAHVDRVGLFFALSERGSKPTYTQLEDNRVSNTPGYTSRLRSLDSPGTRAWQGVSDRGTEHHPECLAANGSQMCNGLSGLSDTSLPRTTPGTPSPWSTG